MTAATHLPDWNPNKHGRPLAAWAASEALKSLTWGARIVWYALHVFLDGNTLEGEASFWEIAEQAGLSRRGAIGVIAQLEEARLLKREHQKNSWGGWWKNRYRMLPPAGCVVPPLAQAPAQKPLAPAQKAAPPSPSPSPDQQETSGAAELVRAFHLHYKRPHRKARPVELQFAQSMIDRYGDRAGLALGKALASAGKKWTPDNLQAIANHLPEPADLAPSVYEKASIKEAIDYMAEMEEDRAQQQAEAARKRLEEEERAAAAAAEELQALPGVLGRLAVLVGDLDQREIPASVRPARRSILDSRRKALGRLAVDLRERADRGERVLGEARGAVAGVESLLDELKTL